MRSLLVRIGMFLGAVVASVGLATSVAARPGHGGLARIEHRIERLDLPADTQAAALAILDEARPEQRALRAQVRDARETLRTLLAAEPVDEAAVMAQAEVVGALEHEARKLGLRTLLEVREVLSPEQRAQLAALGEGRRRR